MGELLAIYIKRMKRGPMDPAREATLFEGRGIAGNANQGGKRQVTLLEEEAWTAMMNELGKDLPPTTRRANLLIRGLQLEKSRGRIVVIGPCRIRIYGETRPCEQMEEAAQGLCDAMSPHWRGGAFGEVIRGGTIRIGEEVYYSEE